MIDRCWGLLADVDVLVSLGADVAVKATLICLAALAADRLLGRRVLGRSAVWHASLLGLVLLAPAAVCFPQWRVACLPGEQIGAASPHYPKTTATFSERKATMAAIVPARAVEKPSFVERTAEVAQPMNGRGKLMIAAAIVYLAGVCFLLVRLFGSWLRAAALVRSSIAVEDAAWNCALDEGRRRLGLARRVELRTSEAIGVPLFVGWWRPTILLPAGLARAAAPQTRRAALLHELAHARRGDYAWNLLLRLTQALYWPHPLIWLAGKAIARVREEACDRVCVFWLGDAAVYRETLVELAAGLVRRPAASLGMAIARSTRLERRLAQLEQGRALPRCLLSWPIRAALAGVIVVAAGALAALHLDRSSTAIADDQPTKHPSANQPAERAKTAGDNSPGEAKPARPAADDSATSAETTGPNANDAQTDPTVPAIEPVKVRVAKVKREDFVVYKSSQPCTLVASRTVSLYARVSGIITRRNAELGDRVKKGDVLAEIDAPEIAEDVLIAQADADEAEATRLQAEASVEVAQANIAEAKAALLQSEVELEASGGKVAYRTKAFERIKQFVKERSVEAAVADEKEEQLREAQAAERSAKGSRKAAEANVSRAAAQFEAVKATLQVARLRAAAAQRHLERIRQHTEYLQIRAPIDGAITEIDANVGSLTAGPGKGEPLFELSVIDTLIAVVNLPAHDALKVKQGDSVTLRFDALPKHAFAAKVSRMAAAFDPQSRTLRTEIHLDNREALLRPGMYGAAAVYLETHPNVLTIPKPAYTPFVGQPGDKRGVYRVVDGRAVRTPVRVLSSWGDTYEVLEGLAEGDVVVAQTRRGLRDGTPVEIEREDDDESR